MKKVTVFILFIFCLFHLSLWAEDIVASIIRVLDKDISFSEDSGIVTFGFTIEKEGEYFIDVEYRSTRNMVDDIEFALDIDGENVTNNGYFTLPRVLLYGDIRKDEYGNDLRSLTSFSSSTYKERLRLKNMSGDDPYNVYLSKGTHTIKLEVIRGGFDLVSLSISPFKEMWQYDASQKGEIIRIEAENIARSSAAMLQAQYDTSDYLTSPQSPSSRLLNIAGGGNWSVDGQWMEYDFYAEEGSYYLSFRYRQNSSDFVSSFRKVYIDGKELSVIEYPYSRTWNINEKEYFFGLSQGMHTLRIEVVPGENSSVVSKVSDVAMDLNDIYRRIIMVTGTTPDRNREYALDKEIDGLMDSIASSKEKLEEVERELREKNGKENTYREINILSNQLDLFIEDPEVIPSLLDSFRSNISSLFSWIHGIKSVGLDLDWIEIVPEGERVTSEKRSVFSSIAFSLESLLSSFSIEKNSDSDITVWISTGRDQLQLVEDMISEFFTPEFGINVKINLVNSGIEQAVLADQGPDVILYLGNTVPVTLAMRNALESLDEYDGLDSVIEIYGEESFVPYTFQGKIYGIPLTEQFPVMFIRDDIFDELGLKVPQTWDDFRALIPVIQRNNLDVGLNSGYATFVTLLLQNGGELYSKSASRTHLDTEEANKAFRDYTRFYSDYSLDLTFDFFNRFRSGEMPMAITDYSEYGRLVLAAPEISGLYSIYRVPGTVNGDEINNTVASSGGTGMVMLKSANNKEDAWIFMKWFSSVEMQKEYALRIEGLLGQSGRYQSASKDVVKSIGWLENEKNVLLETKGDLKAIRQVPGSYYLQRNIISAFRQVVFNGRNSREMLENYGEIINRELARKRQELGLEVLDD